MKANELMVGDWIADKDGDKVQVDNIINSEFDCGIDVVCNRFDGRCDSWTVPFEEAQPIPLTAEILEKNGFVHRQSVTWGDIFTYAYAIVQKDKVLQYEQHFNLSPNPYEGSGFYWIPEMSAVSALRVVYVHELQDRKSVV